MRIRPAVSAALALVSAALVVAPASAAPMSLLYDLDPAVRAIVAPADGQRALTAERGAHRQEPSGGHLFAGGADAANRVAKVSMRELAPLSGAAIAARLRQAIDHGCQAFGCASHLVSIDEAGSSVADPVRRKVTRSSLGARLSAAMKVLSVPSPWGGTYASRVHIFIAPAMSTAIAKGRGPDHDLGRDRKPHFRTWRGVAPALARAGGVWIEMYHGTAGSTVTSPMTAREWRTVAPAMADLVSRHGGADPSSRLHFLFTDALMPSGAPAGCGSPMACSWALASSTPANQAVLANGPGTYRVGEAAAEWLAQYNLRFP